MKKLLLSNLLLFIVLQLIPAQQAVPVGKEPRHKTKFENQYVRVIDAAVAVGDATLYHTHDLDNVPVNVSGGKLKTETVGQAEATFTTMETGRTSFAKGGYTHRITNVGDTPLRFIDAEILSPYGKSSTAAILDAALEKTAGHTLISENERVRLYRVIIEPGQTIAAHAHVLPRLSVSVSGGKLAIHSNDRKAKTKTFKVGDFSWHKPESQHVLKNLGAEKYESVEIEWK
jgi:quercetin dioxygenase-like cupin family protein